MTDKPKCPNCGVPWIEHLGIAGTCRKLELARTALKVIHTWASFDNGSELKPKHVRDLTKRALEETK